jgi:putative endonuclease
MASGQYYVYIMSNASKTLYIGVTNDIDRRVYEHRNKIADGFTKRYNITKLVYFEIFSDIKQAIIRETELKGWLRKKKIALIVSMNPKWDDLSKAWGVENETAVQTESSDSSLR